MYVWGTTLVGCGPYNKVHQSSAKLYMLQSGILPSNHWPLYSGDTTCWHSMTNDVRMTFRDGEWLNGFDTSSGKTVASAANGWHCSLVVCVSLFPSLIHLFVSWLLKLSCCCCFFPRVSCLSDCFLPYLSKSLGEFLALPDGSLHVRCLLWIMSSF